MTQTSGPAPRSFAGELRDGITPRATLLVVGVLALQLLFIASYVGALHSPRLRDVPFGVVAPRAAAEQAVDRLERLPGEPLDRARWPTGRRRASRSWAGRSTAPC